MAFNALGIGGVLPSFGKLASGDVAGGLLDLAFKDCCLIMENTSLLTSFISISLPLPVLGFQFKTPEVLTLAKYQYAEYPYLNKVAVVNSFLKEVCPIEITGLRPITRENNVVVNYLANWAGIKYYIEKYADRGGTWTLNTMWGMFTGLVLTQLDGIKVENTEMGGVGFKFSFQKINFSNIQNASSSISSLASALGG